MDQISSVGLKSRPKICIVIGSGGIRSLAALPILAHLQRKNVPIDLIIGSGGGATLAGLFAAGYPIQQIPKLMAKLFDPKVCKKLDYRQLAEILGLVSKTSNSPPAPFNNKMILSCLKGVFTEKRLENLPYHVIMQATEMSTGRSVSFEKGLIADCVYASNAMYPYFPPILIDDKWMAAGVHSAALPMSVAVHKRMDIILVVNVNDSLNEITADSLIDSSSSFFNRSSTHSQGREISLAISMHEGEALLMNVAFVKQINLWDIKYVDEIMQAGEKTLQNNVDEIDALTNLSTA